MIAHEQIRAIEISIVDQTTGRESDHGASTTEMFFSSGSRMIETTHTLFGF